MTNLSRAIRLPLAVIGSASLLALGGCDSERQAEADTPVSEAEVRTDLPESAVSDEQLQTSANIAADMAATPPPEVIPVPVPADGTATGGTAAAGAGNAAAGNNVTTNTAGQ